MDYKIGFWVRFDNVDNSERTLSIDGKRNKGGSYLIDVAQFEVFQHKNQHCRDCFDDDLLVPIHINAQLH